MMWISLLLVVFSALNQSLYWDFVADLRDIGCHVYNEVYVSCPVERVPPGAVPIPVDAVEVIP